jgi:glutamate-1-semialdehyde aminotransferase
MFPEIRLRCLRQSAGIRRMLDLGFYTPPSAFEVDFISAAHTAEHIEAFTQM